MGAARAGRELITVFTMSHQTNSEGHLMIRMLVFMMLGELELRDVGFRWVS